MTRTLVPKSLAAAASLCALLSFPTFIHAESKSEKVPAEAVPQLRFETRIAQVTYVLPNSDWGLLVVKDEQDRCFAHRYGNIIAGADRANTLLQAKEDQQIVILTADVEWGKKEEYSGSGCFYLSGIEMPKSGNRTVRMEK